MYVTGTIQNKMARYNRTKTNEGTLRLGEAGKYLDVYYPELEEKYNMVTKLITCVYNPNDVTIEQAWKNILKDSSRIDALFTKMPEVIYALLCIEVHNGKRTVSGKRKEKQEKNQIEKMKKHHQDAVDLFIERHGRNPDEFKDSKLILKYKEELHPTKEKKLSLDGYPHIHIALGLTSYDGTMISDHEISKMIMENTNFVDDVQTDSRSTKYKKNCTQQAVVKYVLKNCKHQEAYDKLGKNDNCMLFNYNGKEDLLEVFRTLTEKKRCIIKIIDHRDLPVEIKPEPPKTRTVKVPVVKRVSAVQKDRELSRAFIADYMRKRHYVIRKGTNDVYQRIEGSKRSWKFFDTFDEFVHLVANEPEMTDSVLMNKKYHVDSASSRHQVFFPAIHLNFNWIEFFDFYFHIPSAQYYLCDLPKDIHTPFYVLDVNFKDSQTRKPDLWLEIIKRQSFAKDESLLRSFFAKFYSTLMPLKHKDKVLMLIGPPNTGKSSVVEPYRGLTPKEFITQLTKSERFQYQGLEGKRLIAFDDVDDKTISNNNFKKLMEGGCTELQYEKKGVNGTHSIQTRFNMYICTNDIPTAFRKDMYDPFTYRYHGRSDEITEEDIMDFARQDPVRTEIDRACYKDPHHPLLNEAAGARVMPFKFDFMIDKKISSIKNRIGNIEYALVFLFCAPYYVQVYLEECANPPYYTEPLPIIDKWEDGLDEMKYAEKVMCSD